LWSLSLFVLIGVACLGPLCIGCQFLIIKNSSLCFSPQMPLLARTLFVWRVGRVALGRVLCGGFWVMVFLSLVGCVEEQLAMRGGVLYPRLMHC